MKWIESESCHVQLHCKECRSNKFFRETIFNQKMADTIDFECPFGFKIGEEIEQIAIEKASALIKVKRFAKEMIQAMKDGLKIADSKTRLYRQSICDKCQYHNPKGNFGLGECQAPGCGCTDLKTWIQSSKCALPKPKW